MLRIDGLFPIGGRMLKPWQMGTSETVAKKFGKELRRVMFTNPATDKEEEFYLFG